MTSDLEALWRVVEVAVPKPGGLRTHATGQSTALGEVLVAMDEAGTRMLLFPTDDRDHFAADSSTKVHLARRTLEWLGGTGEFVTVTCSVDRLKPVFTTLAGDMMEAAAGTAEPGVVLRSVLEEWRDLLSVERRSVLSRSRLVGLTAELITLRDVLRHDRSRDVTIWTGPDQTLHDLRRNGRALEVKGSLAREGLFVEIHGVRQLEPPPDGELHLVFHRFEEAPEGDISAPDIIAEILDLGVDRRAFVTQLTAAGYDLADNDQYVKERFRQVERRIYAVGPDFPRIVPASFASGELPAGVILLRYTVDLTGAFPSPLSPEGAEAVLVGFGSGR